MKQVKGGLGNLQQAMESLTHRGEGGKESSVQKLVGLSCTLRSSRIYKTPYNHYTGVFVNENHILVYDACLVLKFEGWSMVLDRGEDESGENCHTRVSRIY